MVAEGLTLFGGCHLALDATLVSPLHRDGTHRKNEDTMDGMLLRAAKKDKEKTCPELFESNGLARLVVIACEVGRRWSEETEAFLWCLACAQASSTPKVMYGSAQAAWYKKLSCVLACS